MKFVKIVSSIIAVLGIIWLLLFLASQKKYPVNYGMSFSTEYAESLNLDARVVYMTMLDELRPEYIRIAANWRDVEAVQGVYDFTEIDWMMDTAAEHNTKVLLVVGQKAPRWPECHIPEWNDYGQEDAKEHLLGYVRATVLQYKDHPALETWQVENEPFIRFAFGECEGYNEEAIYEEIAIVRELDPERNILITDSGELGLWHKAGKTGDLFGTTLYRIVRSPGGRIFTYDWVPAAFYRLKAKLLGISLDRFWVAELQAEPWFSGGDPHDTTIEEQEETMNPERLAQHIDYVERIGVDRTYFWGVEWWYFMKEQHGDARYWDIVKDTIGAAR
ncbi:MAG: hypothetical protein COU33_03935 [Candidatus Magasanikbacteria bacterium CG10_big_fil_rev_8_21_14_0_10_43_6]|uniref:Uncharacterized protein n=1 Tax=Candidatus Magasanikbacteria bacterium CG10_big_fil_rev_8_21_14_0_10_43_6 TaxID=1974650 RepID=A0A2M6W0E9_9BACT|nr:MAG: hypothetical protein COU33_03935 [Candidatus Magasanikbacteria bacterium CG10_big_fil_rev_8_21_14_0_10_43_6]